MNGERKGWFAERWARLRCYLLGCRNVYEGVGSVYSMRVDNYRCTRCGVCSWVQK